MRNKIALLSTALLLAAAGGFAASEGHVHQVVSLDANGQLSLGTHNGSITVSTWDQPRVEIDARIEPGDSGYPDDVAQVRIDIEGSGPSVRVDTNYDAVPSHRMAWWFGDERVLPLVHYTITMPRTASLEIGDHNASVRTSGLDGDLRITAHNGDIEVTGQSGAAEIRAHNADVRVGFRRFAHASEIETHNGAIEVRLPADARFDIDASGHHLGVDSDFPVTTRSVDGGSYTGKVNGGGPRLRISTHNGAVRLHRS